MLEYDPVSDTSLVECHPVTGRTHQLRVHLQFLGNPIANDPCYGGELFYNDVKRRSNAITLLKALKRLDYQPLSKIPHISMDEKDAVVDKEVIDLEMKEIDKIVAEYSDITTGSKSLGETPDSMSKIDQLKQNCRFELNLDLILCFYFYFYLFVLFILFYFILFSSTGTAKNTNLPQRLSKCCIVMGSGFML